MRSACSRVRRPAGSTVPADCSIPRRPLDARSSSRPHARCTRPASSPADAVGVLLGAASARGEEAREREQGVVDTLDLPTRDAEQRVRRAQRGAERDEVLAELEGLEAWYRDLVVVAAGAEGAVVHADRLDDLREDVAGGRRGRRGRGGRDGARDVARARGVQPEPVARARGAVRPICGARSPARRVLPAPDAATLIRPRRRSSAGRALHS